MPPRADMESALTNTGEDFFLLFFIYFVII